MSQHASRTPATAEAAEAAEATEAAEAAEGAGAAQAARQARFGALPERVRPEDTVEEHAATTPDPARDAYSSDDWLVRYCL